jgi:hypothetical protein
MRSVARSHRRRRRRQRAAETWSRRQRPPTCKRRSAAGCVSRSVDPDRLGDGELLDAGGGELPAVAGPLHATEGEVVVGSPAIVSLQCWVSCWENVAESCNRPSVQCFDLHFYTFTVRPLGLEPGTCGLRVLYLGSHRSPRLADMPCELLTYSHSSPPLAETGREL